MDHGKELIKGRPIAFPAAVDKLWWDVGKGHGPEGALLGEFAGKDESRGPPTEATGLAWRDDA